MKRNALVALFALVLTATGAGTAYGAEYNIKFAPSRTTGGRGTRIGSALRQADRRAHEQPGRGDHLSGLPARQVPGGRAEHAVGGRRDGLLLDDPSGELRAPVRRPGPAVPRHPARGRVEAPRRGDWTVDPRGVAADRADRSRLQRVELSVGLHEGAGGLPGRPEGAEAPCTELAPCTSAR